MATMPPRQTLEAIARRSRRPRWGLRFLVLLGFAGAATYFARPFVPWVDTRVTAVELSLRELGRQYGFIDGAPSPLIKPKGQLPATSPDVALARAGSRGMGRPEIQPMTSPARPAAAAPAAAPVRGGAPLYRAGSPAARAALAAARAGYANPAAVKPPRRRTSSYPRRRRYAAARAALPTAAVAAPALAAAPAAPPEPTETVEEVPPPPATPAPPEPLSAKAAAASSGDDLDQLMASSIGSAPRASDLDKKLANVQKGDAVAAAKAEKVAAKGGGVPPLSRSDIQTVMRDVQAEMGDCYRKTGKGGPVDLKIDVAPEGDVKSTVLRGDFAGTETGACVDAKVKAAVFPPSSGLRFDYRLVVR